MESISPLTAGELVIRLFFVSSLFLRLLSVSSSDSTGCNYRQGGMFRVSRPLVGPVQRPCSKALRIFDISYLTRNSGKILVVIHAGADRKVLLVSVGTSSRRKPPELNGDRPSWQVLQLFWFVGDKLRCCWTVVEVVYSTKRLPCRST